MDNSNSVRPFLVGIILTCILGYLLFSKGCFPTQRTFVTTTDTVFVKQPYKEIVIKKVATPTMVYIYKTDTVFRKFIEKDTLISSVEITPQLAKVHTITPKGLPIIKEYPLLDYRKIQINHEGNIAIHKKKHPQRRKFLKRLAKVGIFVGGVFVGKELTN